LTEHQKLNEYLMTSLRTIWGCDLNKIEQEWGAQEVAILKKESQIFIEKNWMSTEQQSLKLTKEGRLFADHIASELFFVEE
jgi:oxygen-independent coproporphyrinogen-3 oxidase